MRGFPTFAVELFAHHSLWIQSYGCGPQMFNGEHVYSLFHIFVSLICNPKFFKTNKHLFKEKGAHACRELSLFSFHAPFCRHILLVSFNCFSVLFCFFPPFAFLQWGCHGVLQRVCNICCIGERLGTKVSFVIHTVHSNFNFNAVLLQETFLLLVFH